MPLVTARGSEQGGTVEDHLIELFGCTTCLFFARNSVHSLIHFRCSIGCEVSLSEVHIRIGTGDFPNRRSIPRQLHAYTSTLARDISRLCSHVSISFFYNTWHIPNTILSTLMHLVCFPTILHDPSPKLTYSAAFVGYAPPLTTEGGFRLKLGN